MEPITRLEREVVVFRVRNRLLFRLVAEGVFYGDGNAFAPLPPPDDEEVERLLRRVARRVWKLARARYPDGLPYAEDAKDALTAASAQTRLHLPAGEERPAPRRRRCAFFEGYSLHADTWCGENDKGRAGQAPHALIASRATLN